MKKGAYHTAWAVPLTHFLRAFVHTRMGRAHLSGHKLGSGAGHCSLDSGGLSHPDEAVLRT